MRLILLTLFILLCTKADAQGWEDIANEPAGRVPLLTVANNGILYAVIDGGIKKYDGTHWEDLPDTTALNVIDDITTDSNGILYVSVMTNEVLNPDVLRYVNGKWESLHFPEWSSYGNRSCYLDRTIAFDKNNVLYMTFIKRDGFDCIPNRVFLTRYENEKWETVGTSDIDSHLFHTSLSFGLDGTPYVAYSKSEREMRVTFPRSGRLVGIGGLPIYGTFSQHNFMKTDHSGAPVIAYKDGKSGYGIISRYNGVAWEKSCPSDTGKWCRNIMFDDEGIGYIFYEQGYPTYTQKIERSNNCSWELMGDYLSMDMAHWPVIKKDRNGPSYVAFVDIRYNPTSNWIRIRRFGPTRIKGSDTVCKGNSISLYNGVKNGSWSSSDTSIASVSDVGEVKGIANGMATISYTVSGNSSIHNIWVEKCGSTVINDEIQITPNPSKGIFSIIVPSVKTEPTTIIASNMLGQKIAEVLTATNTAMLINIGTIPGTYTISAFTGSKRLHTKVTVQ